MVLCCLLLDYFRVIAGIIYTNVYTDLYSAQIINLVLTGQMLQVSQQMDIFLLAWLVFTLCRHRNSEALLDSSQSKQAWITVIE